MRTLIKIKSPRGEMYRKVDSLLRGKKPFTGSDMIDDQTFQRIFVDSSEDTRIRWQGG